MVFGMLAVAAWEVADAILSGGKSQPTPIQSPEEKQAKIDEMTARANMTSEERDRADRAARQSQR